MNAGVAASRIDDESTAGPGEAKSSHIRQRSDSVAPSDYDMDTSTPVIGGDSMPVPGVASDAGHDKLDVDMAEFSTLSRMGLNGSDSEDLGVDAVLKEDSEMAAPESSATNMTAPAVERAAPIPVSPVSDSESSCIRANHCFCRSSAIHCKRSDDLLEVLGIDCSLDVFHTCGRNGQLASNHIGLAIVLLLNKWVCVCLLLYIQILTPYPFIPNHPHIPRTHANLRER